MGVILEDVAVPQQVGSLYASTAVVPSFTAPVGPTAHRMPVTIAMALVEGSLCAQIRQWQLMVSAQGIIQTGPRWLMGRAHSEPRQMGTHDPDGKPGREQCSDPVGKGLGEEWEGSRG